MPAGVLVHAAIFVTPTIVVLLIVLTPDAVRRVASRHRTVIQPVLHHRAASVVAAELRRAYLDLRNLGGDTLQSDREEACARYDALLAEACAVAGVPCDRLHGASGLDRDIARLGLEEALIERGFAPH